MFQHYAPSSHALTCALLTLAPRPRLRRGAGSAPGPRTPAGRRRIEVTDAWSLQAPGAGDFLLPSPSVRSSRCPPSTFHLLPPSSFYYLLPSTFYYLLPSTFWRAQPRASGPARCALPSQRPSRPPCNAPPHLSIRTYFSSSPLLGFTAAEPAHCGYKRMPSNNKTNNLSIRTSDLTFAVDIDRYLLRRGGGSAEGHDIARMVSYNLRARCCNCCRNAFMTKACRCDWLNAGCRCTTVCAHLF